MYTDYLKATLQRIVSLQADVSRIREYTDYPTQSGALQAVVSRAICEAESALRWTVDHVEAAEREGERLVSILEAIGIELDEETLATLELIGKRTFGPDNREISPYRDERRTIGNAISKAVAEVQEAERDREQEVAIEALLAAGFIHDEDDDAFNRGVEQVRITLANGRESRYEWEYETSEPVHEIESGKSGEFSRLLALIVPKPVEVVQ